MKTVYPLQTKFVGGIIKDVLENDPAGTTGMVQKTLTGDTIG